MFAKVLRRPRRIQISPDIIFLRAIVGVWPTKNAYLAGQRPRVRECFTFDVPSNVLIEQRGEYIRDRLRRLIAKWLRWFADLPQQKRLEIPDDNTDWRLDALETDDDPEGITTAPELLALDEEEGEAAS